jgi:hypothetical protein
MGGIQILAYLWDGPIVLTISGTTGLLVALEVGEGRLLRVFVQVTKVGA